MCTIVQEKSVFQPIAINLESREEVEQLINALSVAMQCNCDIPGSTRGFIGTIAGRLEELLSACI